jgi:hypothetical protein
VAESSCAFLPFNLRSDEIHGTMPSSTVLRHTVSFAHGTSLENAHNIQQMGLDATAARAHSLGAHAPGAFFTHLLGPPDEPGRGLQMAYEWGLRHSAMPVVLIGELPEHVFRELEVSRRIVTQPVPGAQIKYHVPHEMIFYPAAYPIVNQHVQWQIVDPYGTQREERTS